MPPSSESPGNINLLLIEDDRVDQMAFLRLFREQQPSYSVRVASSLAEARTLLSNESVDIVVCDFYLGDGTSFEILPDLRARKIPAIVVSGADDKNAASEAKEKGACDYLVKDQNYNYLKVLPGVLEQALANCYPDRFGKPVETASVFVSASHETAPDQDTPRLPDSEDLRLRRIIIDQSELVARYRPDGIVLYVNDVYCRYFGKTRGELIGQPLGMEMPESDRHALMHEISRMSWENPSATLEHRVALPNQEIHWIRRTDRAVFDESGVLIEYQMVASDITERKQAEEALKESEERYRMLAEHAFDGILIQDLTGAILYTNQSIQRMFGFSNMEDVLGKNTMEFISPESREMAIRDLQNVISGNQGYIQKYTAMRPDGTQLIIESVGTLIPYQGKTANIVALRDVTEREHAQIQLKNELERKKDFINVAAHELRTPLQPVIGYIDLLLDPGTGLNVPPDALAILKTVREYVEQERRMVNQILELSLLESVHEHFWPAMAPVRLREIVDLVVAQGNYAKEATITVHVPESLTLESSGPYLHEILDEILANAVSYSHAPRFITIESEETESGVKISVTDNGIGIPPDKLEIIFDPFYISDADKLSRKYGRLGVGLTMARSRAVRLGGTLTATSVYGIGSTFILTLPRESRK